jgi:hypothetical protein
VILQCREDMRRQPRTVPGNKEAATWDMLGGGLYTLRVTYTSRERY